MGIYDYDPLAGRSYDTFVNEGTCNCCGQRFRYYGILSPNDRCSRCGKPLYLSVPISRQSMSSTVTTTASSIDKFAIQKAPNKKLLLLK